ncbi:MAG: hypothetical protein J6L00_04030 [Clostridia bacterium]|nr:hypothetical protein [Clostridia bacterium]
MFSSIDARAAVFGVASLALIAIAVVIAAVYHRRVSRAKRLFTAWQVFTAGAYVAVAVQYLPIIHTVNNVDNLCHRRFTTVVWSFVEAARVFALDGDVEMIRNGLSNVTTDWLQQVYTAAAVLTLLLAPVLTAVAVLSFFRSVTARIQYAVSGKKPLYVLSKLNSQSVALARSIRQAKGKKATIVFTDVFLENGEDGFALMCEAQESDVGGICLKQDITHLRLAKNRKAALFVIGDDESENLEQAIRLTAAHKKRANTTVYVYANSDGGAHVIDAIQKGDLLIPPATREKLLDPAFDVQAFLQNGAKASGLSFDGGFRILRMDSVYSLVLDTFCKSHVFELCNDKVISLLIVGMGEYGKQILKTALWFCQMDGYRLEINVVDSGIDKTGRRDIEEVLRQECPEILSKNPCRIDGEATYDLRFYKNVDCFTAAFDRLFENPASAARLRRTTMAFVALGDDDKNIRVSIMLRKLFDRLQGVDNAACEVMQKTGAADAPRIYAVVYDDKKAENLNVEPREKEDSFLVNYKGTPYHVQFIGNLSSHFAYTVIENEQKREAQALDDHIRWIQADGVEGRQNVINGITSFLNFEYYRQSSVAKAVHKEMLESTFGTVGPCTGTDKTICYCEACRRKKTEHMRWNAYMRVNGYCYGERRADRALVHPDLRRWQDLSQFSKKKD